MTKPDFLRTCGPPTRTFDPERAEKLRAVGLRVAGRLLADNPGCEAYLSGSIYGGLGTRESDIDLYVVAAPEVLDSLVVSGRAEGTGADVVHVVEDGLVVDVEGRTMDHVDDLRRRYDAYRFTVESVAQVSFTSTSRLMDACRLFLGEPVGTSPLVRRTRDALDADVLRKVLIATYAARCSHLQRDFRGQAAAGDDTTLLHLAHRTLLFALEALAAACGHLYYGDKWTWVKLESLGSELHARLRDVAFRPAPGIALEPAALARHWMLAAQSCMCAAMVDGWDAANPAAWNAWPAADGVPFGDGPIRSPAWLPMRTADEVLLGSLDRVVSFSDQGLRLWGLCDGRPRARVIDDMEAWLKARSLDATRESIEDYLDALIETGVVEG